MRQVKVYTVVDEPYEIYRVFKGYAHKSMRLYLHENSLVSPLEMLAIMGSIRELKKQYLLFDKSDIIISNIKSILRISGYKVEGDNLYISISPRPLPSSSIRLYRFSLILCLAFVVLVTCLYSAIGLTSGLGMSFSVAKIYNENQLASALNGSGCYQLMRNIEITNMYSHNVFNGTLIGNNYSIIVKNDKIKNILKTNNGRVLNLNIVYGNIVEDIDSSVGLLTLNNSGNIVGVNISVSSLNVNCTKSNNDIFITSLAVNNSGIIDNCSLAINGNVESKGNGECSLSAFVGINDGVIRNCVVRDGSILSGVEVDIAGIVAINNVDGNIENCSNYATISQASSRDGWSPTVAGIALTNYGEIISSNNIADITAQSNNDGSNASGNIMVGGIASINYGTISDCLSRGELIAQSKKIIVYCGGITAYSTYYTSDSGTSVPAIEDCGVEGNINVSNEYEEGFVFAGGISGYLYGNVSKSYSLSTFTNGFDEKKSFIGLFVGGVYLQYGIFGGGTICVNASGNDVLFADNVSYQLGALISGSTIAKVGYDLTSSEVVVVVSEDVVDKKGVL